MRTAFLVLLLALPFILPVQAQGDPPRIAEVHPDPADGGREFIELWNPGPEAREMQGWVVQDAVGTTFTFPSWSVPAGGRVVVWGGGSTDAAGPAWDRTTVWNNAGDQILLKDPGGATVDRFAYGDHPAAGDPAPGKGQSLALTEDSAWVLGDPTPGSAASSTGGPVVATVAHVPPTIQLVDVPTHAVVGSTVQVTFRIEDGNGDAVTWTLDAPEGMQAQGSGNGTHSLTLQTPDLPVRWGLALNATDATGNSTLATWVVDLHSAVLEVVLPDGGLHFPLLRPGAVDVEAEGAVTLRNHAGSPVTPRLDMSDLAGPDGATIPVQDRLQVVLPDGVVLGYDGPMTPLPDLGPGEEVQFRIRLAQVPSPLPAGPYGTSFTVTP